VVGLGLSFKNTGLDRKFDFFGRLL